jgi:hypothetical protein
MEDVHELMFRWSESQTMLDEKEREWHEKIESQSSKTSLSHHTSLSSLYKGVADVKYLFSNVTGSIQKQVKY